MDAQTIAQSATSGFWSQLAYLESGYVAEEGGEDESPAQGFWGVGMLDGMQGQFDGAASGNDYGYGMRLSEDEMANLSYVEGVLLMDIGDGEGYVDLG